MSNEIVPLLNAQQQGMSATITGIAARQDAFAQVAQVVASQIVAEESKKLEKTAEDPESGLVSRDGGGNNSAYQETYRQHREKEEDVETCPSYHNPLAGKLVNAKV